MEKEQEPSARPVTLCATSNDGDGDGNGDIMNVCFGSTRIMRIILGFLRFNVYAIFLLRMVSKKFNNWVRPFVFSHLTINRKRFQEYASCHPFPFIPCRILLNDNFDDISPMVTHMTIGKQLS